MATLLLPILSKNDEQMKQAYDPSQPIESLSDQYKDAMELAAAANAAYPPQQIVAYAYNTIFKTGHFTNACRTWRQQWPAKLGQISKLTSP
jgi:hypothetical protein